MQFNMIGVGRLGSSLAAALIHRCHWQLVSVCNQQQKHAEHQVAVLGMGVAADSIDALLPAKVTFLTTPDDQLPMLAESLAKSELIRAGDIVIHCSGVHSSAILAALKSKGAYVGSIHPLKAFPSSVPNPDAFEGCDCVVEGDDSVVNFLLTLFGQLGAKMVCLDADKKQLYHAAAAMASNYLVTLAAAATSMLTEAGIQPEQAKLMCERLMENSLLNIKGSVCAEQALTGPLMRGDINTVLLHLNAIECPQIEGFYRAAGLATLPFTNNTDEQKMALKALLMTPHLINQEPPKWV